MNERAEWCGLFTNESARAVMTVHAWVRFAAIVGACSALILLAVTVVASGLLAGDYPQLRGAIAGVGTLYACCALGMLCAAFLLARYSAKLESAAKLRRASVLMEALTYETGYWMITAAYAVLWFVSTVITFPQAVDDIVASVRHRQAQISAVEMQAARAPGYRRRVDPEEGAAIPPPVAIGLNVGAIAFTLTGAALIGKALTPARRPRNSLSP
ncbi:MAG TPA: hypothetical protein VE010_08690 [Thermoanaerobaculia bacterium]|nr:hypothetical protein [Thermoanaerobaculia bacterium]